MTTLGLSQLFVVSETLYAEERLCSSFFCTHLSRPSYNTVSSRVFSLTPPVIVPTSLCTYFFITACTLTFYDHCLSPRHQELCVWVAKVTGFTLFTFEFQFLRYYKPSVDICTTFCFPKVQTTYDLLLTSLLRVISHHCATCTLYSNQARVLTVSEIWLTHPHLCKWAHRSQRILIFGTLTLCLWMPPIQSPRIPFDQAQPHILPESQPR